MHSTRLSLPFGALLLGPLIACSCGSTGGTDLATEAASYRSPGEAFDHTHAPWTEYLARHVQPEGVDYSAMVAEQDLLDRYLATLQGTQPAELEGWSENERFAFWINTYNAHVIKVILENYPLDSIRDLGGLLPGAIFRSDIVPMRTHDPDGRCEMLSLNEIENDILRAQFPDARLHAAINCASVSCPPLLPEAFVAERLDEQLDRVVRGWIADPARNRLDRASGTLHLSRIFDWFGGDFEEDGGARAFVARHAGADTDWIEGASIRFLDYDWGLNDAPR